MWLIFALLDPDPESGSTDLVESGSGSKSLLHAYMENSVSDTDLFYSNLDQDFLLNSDQNCLVEKNIFNNALLKYCNLFPFRPFMKEAPGKAFRENIQLFKT